MITTTEGWLSDKGIGDQRRHGGVGGCWGDGMAAQPIRWRRWKGGGASEARQAWTSSGGWGGSTGGRRFGQRRQGGADGRWWLLSKQWRQVVQGSGKDGWRQRQEQWVSGRAGGGSRRSGGRGMTMAGGGGMGSGEGRWGGGQGVRGRIHLIFLKKVCAREIPPQIFVFFRENCHSLPLQKLCQYYFFPFFKKELDCQGTKNKKEILPRWRICHNITHVVFFFKIRLSCSYILP